MIPDAEPYHPANSTRCAASDRLRLAEQVRCRVAENQQLQAQNLDARPALFAWLGLGVFDRPAPVAVLLAQLGGVVRPLSRDAAFLMSRFSPSLLRCFGAATIEASMIWSLIARNPAAANVAIEPLEENLDRRFIGQSACVSASPGPALRAPI